MDQIGELQKWNWWSSSMEIEMLHWCFVVCSPLPGISGSESRRIEAVSSQDIKVRPSMEDDWAHLNEVDNQVGKQINQMEFHILS
ncbi:unnamed protein product [Dovyalis caffra]|uniref:Uncharacterized protein n=1 Tax=Dovyalis caffra TaxID=77055 RepID=A0AAV1RVQ8_9ROSI|nr:unnamed protein product [Dovyalis caffra]